MNAHGSLRGPRHLRGSRLRPQLHPCRQAARRHAVGIEPDDDVFIVPSGLAPENHLAGAMTGEPQEALGYARESDAEQDSNAGSLQRAFQRKTRRAKRGGLKYSAAPTALTN